MGSLGLLWLAFSWEEKKDRSTEAATKGVDGESADIKRFYM